MNFKMLSHFKKFVPFHVIAVGVVVLGSATMSITSAFAQHTDPIRIGAVAPKTGPLGAGAAVTFWPNVELWEHQVNSVGGLLMSDGTRRPIQIIEYDDRTDPSETIRSVQRLANNDNADFILAPYGTGLALAAAPIFDRLGYPMINVSAITDQTDTLVDRFDGVFFTLGKTTPLAQGIAQQMVEMKDSGLVGGRVAMVNVADAFGIELAQAARGIFEQAGFEIVYSRSYPPTIQDLTPVMSAVIDTNPDIFVAFSYPPDTFGLTEAAQIQGLQVDAFYTAVATPFPSFGNRFGESANGVFGVGGINPESESFLRYEAAHIEVTGQAPDFWASPVTYASFEVLAQAIEGVGSTDRQAVTEFIKNNTFETVMGEWRFENQQITDYWTVGQWQNGRFYGIRGTGNMDGSVSPIASPQW